jgi:hypothetical protein
VSGEGSSWGQVRVKLVGSWLIRLKFYHHRAPVHIWHIFVSVLVLVLRLTREQCPASPPISHIQVDPTLEPTKNLPSVQQVRPDPPDSWPSINLWSSISRSSTSSRLLQLTKLLKMETFQANPGKCELSLQWKSQSSSVVKEELNIILRLCQYKKKLIG